MPFANFKLPAGSLTAQQKELIVHRTTDLLAEIYGEVARPNTLVRAGAEARFTKTSRVLAHLAGGRADRTWDKRLAELTRPAVLVLDDFGMRELTAPGH